MIRDAAPDDLAALLTEVEANGEEPDQQDRPVDAAGALRFDMDREHRELRVDRIATRDRFRVELHATVPDLVAAPRLSQRNWLVGKAIEECADDIAHLDRLAPTLVPGFDHRLDRDLHDVSSAALSDAQIMEDWQTPLMLAMARHVTASHGDVLEIGFGRGVSAGFIQQFGVRSHTIVEPNDHSVNHHFARWRQAWPDRDIRLLKGRWQEVDDRLGRYDGIFFHAFPMNEQEFTDYVLRSVTFAEHAFASMAAHLVDGGVFTYLTTEIDSLSRAHQRSLFRYFRSIALHVEPLSVPADTRDTWWAQSMVVVKAVR
jgi:guanidinoacetate N-methyltransferase